MPNNFVGHVDKWLLLSESETEFAILFVRAWIPFNAWYCNTYQNTSDRYCIDAIKSDGNQFRAKIVALLQGDFAEAITFRSYLGNLHNLLERHPIPEADVEKRITFKNIWFRENPVTATNPPLKKRGLEYKVERLADKSVVAIIVNTRTPVNATVYNYRHTKYDLSHFEQDININIASVEHRRYIKECFVELNPKKKENLLQTQRTNSIQIGGAYFKNDSILLSQAIVDLMYSLRCKLFHGELQPSLDNLSIYEPCYHMMRILLKSLR